jgi:hypothetical protein
MSYLKTPPTSELDAFKRQTTMYAVFILMEALSVGEATFRNGTLTVDDVQYDCNDHLPVTAVRTYGFGVEAAADAHDETISRCMLGLLESVYLLRAEALVENLEESFGELCEAGPAEWNYYGAFLANESVLPAAMVARAAALFAPMPEPEAESEPAPVKPSRFFSKGHTRRMHGRRALSPIRRTRATDTTRRRRQPQPQPTNTT